LEQKSLDIKRSALSSKVQFLSNHMTITVSDHLTQRQGAIFGHNKCLSYIGSSHMIKSWMNLKPLFTGGSLGGSLIFHTTVLIVMLKQDMEKISLYIMRALTQKDLGQLLTLIFKIKSLDSQRF
jgi:hypothetical protein